MTGCDNRVTAYVLNPLKASPRWHKFTWDPTCAIYEMACAAKGSILQYPCINCVMTGCDNRVST